MTSDVAIQIAADVAEIKEKARNVQSYLSTFDAEIGRISGELVSYSVASPCAQLTSA